MPDHHHCIGAPLARVEGESIFSHLLEHFPGIGCLSFVEREARKRFEDRLGVYEAIDSFDLVEYSHRSTAGSRNVINVDQQLEHAAPGPVDRVRRDCAIAMDGGTTTKIGVSINASDPLIRAGLAQCLDERQHIETTNDNADVVVVAMDIVEAST